MIHTGRRIPILFTAFATLALAGVMLALFASPVHASRWLEAGNEESVTSAATEAATEPTDRPYGLTTTVSENAITLTWQEPDNFYGPDYHILRHRPEEGEPEPLVYVDFTGTDATTFTDTDVETGVLYVYQVRATIDMFATLGEPSELIEARVPERETSDTQQASNTLATGAPAISGTAQVGETLTASASGIADADGLTSVSYSYRWIRNDGATDADISGATSSTYTLADADEGTTIKVKVSFTDDAGHEETLTSAATAAVEPAATGPKGADGPAARPYRYRVGECHHPDLAGAGQLLRGALPHRAPQTRREEASDLCVDRRHHLH